MGNSKKNKACRDPQTKSGRSRERILRTSARLFRERGYEAASMRNIAEAADMKAGSVYYHFESKDAILTEVLERGLRDIYEGVSATVTANVGDHRAKIAAAMREHLVQLLASSDFVATNTRVYSQLPKNINYKYQPLRRAYSEIWETLLRDAQDAGQLQRDPKIIPLRLIVLGALNWTVEWFDSDKYEIDSFIDQITLVLLDGMSAPHLRGSDISVDFCCGSASANGVFDQQIKAPDTREKILKTAAIQFRNHGVEAASMRKIAEAIDMKAGSVYYHFESKDDILCEVLERGLRDVYNGVNGILTAQQDKTNYRSLIAAAIHEHLCQLHGSAVFASANIRLYGQLPENIKAHHRPLHQAYSQIWENLLKNAQVAGQLRSDIEITPLRMFLLGALNWTVEWYDTEKYSIERLAERCTYLLLDGLMLPEE